MSKCRTIGQLWRIYVLILRWRHTPLSNDYCPWTNFSLCQQQINNNMAHWDSKKHSLKVLLQIIMILFYNWRHQWEIVINPTSWNKVLHFPSKMALVCTFPIFLGFSGCAVFSDASGTSIWNFFVIIFIRNRYIISLA